MGKENTGLPWTRQYSDLERGRPAYPFSTIGNTRLIDVFGKVTDLSNVDELLTRQTKLLEAILMVLNTIASTNITEEDIDNDY
jgi:hypothetical protein